MIKIMEISTYFQNFMQKSFIKEHRAIKLFAVLYFFYAGYYASCGSGGGGVLQSNIIIKL